MGIFIYASTATGKTSLGKKYSNVIDMESTKYKYLSIGSISEESKSTKREINKNWPQNYFNALETVKNKYDYILIADEICSEYLLSKKIEYWQIYPSIILKEEYLQRCRERGNNDEFISWYSKLWDTWYYKCKNDNNAIKHIELKKGEFLEDVIPNLKKL